MKLHSTVVAAGVACMVAGCGAASQSQAKSQVASSQCAGLTDSDRQVAALYAPGSIERVEPLQRKVFLARAIQPQYTAGARLYVPAQQGMSGPYLERVLSCHAASSADVHPNDPLRVANIESVDVTTAGPRFVVTIAGADRAAGRAIWERAQALREPSTQVEVRQLSTAPSTSSNM